MKMNFVSWNIPVPKRQETRRQQQRQKILLASARLFWQKGYLGTSTNDIAKAAKVNKAIVYYYFKNKAFLLYEIMMGILRDLVDQSTQICNAGLTPRAKLKALIKNHIEWQASMYGISGIGYMERKNLPPKLLRGYVQLRDEYEKLFHQAIKEGIASGDFQCSDAKLTCLFTLGLVNSIILWYKPQGILSPENIASKAWEIIFEGLKARHE
jgi:AcrR family transcriptional regulator